MASTSQKQSRPRNSDSVTGCHTRATEKSTPNVLTDEADLEARIALAYTKVMVTKRGRDWEALADLIKQRSPERVRAMEYEKGLI